MKKFILGLLFSLLATPALAYAPLDNSTIKLNGSNQISCTTATISQVGCAKPDGTILTISGSTETVAKSSSSAFGVAEVDNTTITSSAGVISSVVGPATTNIFTNKTYDTAGTGNVFKINGTSITAIGGNTGTVGTTSGTLTNGHCVQFDASGNLVDAGGACGIAGSTAFNTLSSGTNTTAAMIVGTGASLTASGSGTITATAVPASGITGTLTLSQEPVATRYVVAAMINTAGGI